MADDAPASILYLDPFHGGSHAAVACGLARHSRRTVRLVTLPARAWKWRMRGAALWFAAELRARPPAVAGIDTPSGIGAIVTTDMLSAADLRALLPAPLAALPLAVYFHENQLTYPDRRAEPRDLHFAFTNITSALAADAIWFNSDFHRQAFLTAVPELLARMPDHRPRDVRATLEQRSAVVPPGIEVVAGSARRASRSVSAPGARDPLILWNHRWEHDKGPEDCFAALEQVRQAGGRFRLAVTGQRFRETPAVFETLGTRFAAELECCGHLPEDDYRRLLARADIVVSTARHEFLGLAVLEAIAAGAYPLLPARLSYPEIIPSDLHADHLYEEDLEGTGAVPARSALARRLLELLGRPVLPGTAVVRASVIERYGWPARAAAFDAAFDALLAGPAGSGTAR